MKLNKLNVNLKNVISHVCKNLKKIHYNIMQVNNKSKHLVYQYNTKHTKIKKNTIVKQIKILFLNYYIYYYSLVLHIINNTQS